jgi:transcriptional regulator with XRE-family HTH domain
MVARAEPDQKAGTPSEPWGSLGTHALTLRESLRAIAEGQSVETRALCLAYSQIAEEISRLAEAGGTPPHGSRLGQALTLKQRQEFGKLLRDRRNQAGLSRLQLARKAKLSDATIKFIETAHSPPSRTTLLRLVAVPELKLSWAETPGQPARAPGASAADAEPPIVAELHRFEARLNLDAVRELTVLVDELRRHQYTVESALYGCRRSCRLCGSVSEAATLTAQQAQKLKVRHAPTCVGQLAESVLQRHPVVSEVAEAERRELRSAAAKELADGLRRAELERFYGCRSGAELAAQLTHNAAQPPSPYQGGAVALLLWALGLGPCPVEPAAEPFSEERAQRLAAGAKDSGTHPPAAQQLRRGIAHAAAWLLDEQAPEPRDERSAFPGDSPGPPGTRPRRPAD